jgi:hypothetical protein
MTAIGCFILSIHERKMARCAPSTPLRMTAYIPNVGFFLPRPRRGTQNPTYRTINKRF